VGSVWWYGLAYWPPYMIRLSERVGVPIDSRECRLAATRRHTVLALQHCSTSDMWQHVHAPKCGTCGEHQVA
jgi:hypothetical protein